MDFKYLFWQKRHFKVGSPEDIRQIRREVLALAKHLESEPDPRPRSSRFIFPENPHQNLALAIIDQAVKDLGSKNPRIAQDAYDWLTSPEDPGSHTLATLSYCCAALYPTIQISPENVAAATRRDFGKHPRKVSKATRKAQGKRKKTGGI